jgi:hypothetical protein
MSGNNLKYQSSQALPTIIRVTGRPASLMKAFFLELDWRSLFMWSGRKC